MLEDEHTDKQLLSCGRTMFAWKATGACWEGSFCLPTSTLFASCCSLSGFKHSPRDFALDATLSSLRLHNVGTSKSLVYDSETDRRLAYSYCLTCRIRLTVLLWVLLSHAIKEVPIQVLYAISP